MTVIIKNPVERARFLKFVIVGIIGFAIDFGVFNLLITVFRANAVLSQVISFCMAVASNFIWNRYWIYPESRAKFLGQQICQFALVNVAGLLIRTPIFAVLEPFLGNQCRVLHTENYGLNPQVIGHNVALAIVVIIVMMWNFFVNRYWTYNDIDTKN